MLIAFDQSFWQGLRVYRIWRGYGPAFFLDLELQDSPDPSILFCVLCFDRAKTYIYKKNERIFDFDFDAPYLDKKLLPMCGLKILGAKIGLDNSLEMSLEQGFKIRVTHSPNGLPKKDRCWNILFNNKISIDFFSKNILINRRIEARKSKYDLLVKDEIKPDHYHDETLEGYHKRMNMTD